MTNKDETCGGGNGKSFVPPTSPEFKARKNGYEIRTELVKFAKDWVESEYAFKLGKWQAKAKIENNQFVWNQEFPEVPGVKEILDIAQKFNDFICKNQRWSD